jgi:MFS family permease
MNVLVCLRRPEVPGFCPAMGVVGTTDRVNADMGGKEKDPFRNVGQAKTMAGTLALYLCLLSGLLGAIQFGWATGVINMPQTVIQDDCLRLSSIEWSVIVAAFTIGGLVGAQMAGGFADRYGRKPFLIWHSVFFIAAGVLQVRKGV